MSTTFDKNLFPEFDIVKDNDEEILWTGKPKLNSYILNGLHYGYFILGLIISLFFRSVTDYSLSFYVIILLPQIFVFLKRRISFDHTAYGYTNKRIMIRSGFIETNFKTIDFDDIYGIQVSVSIFENESNSGSIRFNKLGVYSGGWSTIENPYEIFKMVALAVRLRTQNDNKNYQNRSSTTFDKNLLPEFDSIKGFDEEILWTGKPKFIPYKYTTISRICIYGFIPLIFVPFNDLFKNWWWLYLIILLQQVYVLLKNRFFCSNTIYGFSNKSVMIRSGYNRTIFKTIDFDKIFEIKVIDSMSNIGSIQFYSGQTEDISQGGRRKLYDVWSDIENPYEIFKMVTLAVRLREQNDSKNYQNRSSTTFDKNLLPEFDSIKGYDEEILWTGKPKFIPYIFNEIDFVYFIVGFTISIFLLISDRQFFIFILLYLVYFFFINGLSCSNTVYGYSNKRVMIRSGSNRKNFKTIDFDKIFEIKITFNSIESMSNVGSIQFYSGQTKDIGGEAVQIIRVYDVWSSIENPHEIFEMLKQISIDNKIDFISPKTLRPQKV
jgi:hypothetical protein